MTVSFDRAAAYYDQTRSLPPESAVAVTALLARELSGRRRVIEIAVGTGRISLPLDEMGIPVVGVDVSLPMLAVLRSKPGGKAMPIVQGDITQLPFADQSFDAAIASHIFHLVPDWRTAASELLRTLRPGARALLTSGGDQETGWREVVRARFRVACGDSSQWPVQDQRRADAESWLTERATSRRDLDPIVVRRTSSITEYIDRLSSGQWSWTWNMTAEDRQAAAEVTRRWAAEEIGRLDEQRDSDGDVRWTVLDFA